MCFVLRMHFAYLTVARANHGSTKRRDGRRREGDRERKGEREREMGREI